MKPRRLWISRWLVLIIVAALALSPAADAQPDRTSAAAILDAVCYWILSFIFFQDTLPKAIFNVVPCFGW